MTHIGYSIDVGKQLESQKEKEEQRKQEVPSESYAPPARKEPTNNSANNPANTSAFFAAIGKYVPLLVFVFLIMLAVWSLSRTEDIPSLDVRARQAVLSQLQLQIANEVILEVPLALPQEKERLIAKRLHAALQSPQFKHAVEQASELYKSKYRDERGQTYLYSPDSYYWFRLAKNIEENGHLGTERKNGLSWDRLRNAPFGDSPQEWSLPFVIFHAHTVWKFFDPDVSLEKVSFFLPVFFGVLSVCLVFLIGKKMAGVEAGVIAGGVLALHPVFLLFNHGGYVDTQIIAFFLFCLFWYVFLLIIEHKTLLLTLTSMLVLPLILVAAKKTWAGWYFIAVVCFVSISLWLGILLIQLFLEKKKSAMLLGLACLIFVFSMFFYWFQSEYISDILIRITYDTSLSLFPTAFSSVAELRSVGSLGRFITLVGGFFVASIVLVQGLFLLKKSLWQKPKLSEIFLLTWILLLVVPSFQAIRFLYYILPPFVVLLALGCRSIAENLFLVFIPASSSNERTHLWRLGTYFLLIVLLIFLIPKNIFAQQDALPAANDALFKLGNWLSTTPHDSLLVTWWDKGYIWEVASQRPVLIDGGLFVTSYLYWISHVFSTNDSTLAANVLHATACGARDMISSFVAGRAYTLPKVVHDLFSNKSLQETMNMHSIDSLELTQEDLNLIRCKQPRKTYVIITPDLLYKLGLFRSYASWDFTLAYYRNELRSVHKSNVMNYLREKHNLSEGEALDVLLRMEDQESATPPATHVSEVSMCQEKDMRVFCDNKFEIDLKTLDARQHKLHPQSLVIVNKGVRSQIFYNDSSAEFSLVLFNTGKNWQSLLMDTSLADTMVMRMFFGEQIPFFQQVYVSEDLPERIIVYEPLFQNQTLPIILPDYNLTFITAHAQYPKFRARVENELDLLFVLQQFVSLPLSGLLKEKEGIIEKTVLSATRYVNITVADYLKALNLYTASTKKIVLSKNGINNSFVARITKESSSYWMADYWSNLFLRDGGGIISVLSKPQTIFVETKNIPVPLDIVFMNNEKRVMGVNKSVLPCAQDPCSAYVQENVSFVLYLGEGVSDIYKITEGDHLV